MQGLWNTGLGVKTWQSLHFPDNQWPKRLWLLGILTYWHHDVKSVSFINLCLLSRFSCVWLFATPWTIASQVPLSMGFAKQEYWSGLPLPFSGDLPDQGIKPVSPASPAFQVDTFFFFFFNHWATGEALYISLVLEIKSSFVITLGWFWPVPPLPHLLFKSLFCLSPLLFLMLFSFGYQRNPSMFYEPLTKFRYWIG